ncbi:hypothetical protein ACFWPV_12435 [Streptomyces uncialis]|uniref:hypothetical protein n=1 Tax=Streptomyces uncialis TaxID=1048205 RepID=UPI003658AC50
MTVVVSGCGSSSSEDRAAPAAKPKPKPKTVSVADATVTFQDAVITFDLGGGCPDQAPGACWEEMQSVMEPARTLRKAMNGEKSVGADHWTEAYALIAKMEKGIGVGRDRGATHLLTNRPDVLGSAHELSDWLDANPIA